MDRSFILCYIYKIWREAGYVCWKLYRKKNKDIRMYYEFRLNLSPAIFIPMLFVSSVHVFETVQRTLKLLFNNYIIGMVRSRYL